MTRRAPSTPRPRGRLARLSATLLAAALSLAAGARPAAADPAALYAEGQTAWTARDYPTAVSRLLEFRATAYGRRPGVDFMLGTSGCRIDGRRDWGAGVLDWMLYGYPLTFDSRQLVMKERDLCRTASTETIIATRLASIVEERAAGATGQGKTFYWAGRDAQPVFSYPIRRLREMEREEFTSRLVPLDDPAAAMALAARLAPRASAQASGRVLLISYSPRDQATLAGMAATLDRYIRYLDAAYGIHAPDHFVTVHLTGDFGGVRALANPLHGLDVSEATLGYAFADDLSVVAYVPMSGVGTVMHELFHLLAREGFGDIPQWLDEGMASLYEVSGREGDVYHGLDNWRGQVLDQDLSRRPSVETLIRAEWFLFDDPEQARALEDSWRFEGSMLARDQATMMATARYFAMYLERTGKLAAVFAALRDQDVEALQGDARDRAVALVEATTGRSVDDLDLNFAAWYRAGGPKFAWNDPTPFAVEAATHVVRADLLNVRAAPSTTAERLARLPGGALVQVLREQDGWAEIALRGGGTGWVSSEFLAPR